MNKIKNLILGLLTTISLVTLVTKYCHAQDSINEITKKQFLASSQIKLTPSQITSIFKEAESWLKYDEYADPTPFESSYKLNVFDYFKLNDTYDSELKKEVYKQTPEYKLLLDSLKKIKATYLSTYFYQTGFNKVGGEDFEMSGPGYFENGRTDYQVNYDIQKKGFLIGIGNVLPYHCLRAFLPKVIEDVEFKQLPIQKKYNLTGNSSNSYTQYLFLSMDASTALEIENNRSAVGILLVFEIKGIYTAQYNDNDFLKENYGKVCKVEVVKGGNLRLLIYNKNTDIIYYDKLYTVTAAK